MDFFASVKNRIIEKAKINTKKAKNKKSPSPVEETDEERARRLDIERRRALDLQQAKFDRDRILYDNKVQKRKRIVRAVFAAVIIIALIFTGLVIKGNINEKRYNDAVSLLVENKYDDGLSQFKNLNSDYKDTRYIKEFAYIVLDFDESQRYNYKSTLKSLEEINGIENKKVLKLKKDFQNKVFALEKDYEKDVKQAEYVDSEIYRLCTNLTINSEASIKRAEALYNGQSEPVKELIKNADMIESAKQDYAIISQNYSKAQAVSDKISKIGKVTLKSKDKIQNARQAYDALTYDEVKYVGNYAVLQKAESTYQKLEKKKKEKEDKAKKEAEKKKKKSASKTATGTVYWVPNGKVYHRTDSCPTLSRSRTILSGSPPSGRRKCKVCF